MCIIVHECVCIVCIVSMRMQSHFPSTNFSHNIQLFRQPITSTIVFDNESWQIYGGIFTVGTCDSILFLGWLCTYMRTY